MSLENAFKSCKKTTSKVTNFFHFADGGKKNSSLFFNTDKVNELEMMEWYLRFFF